MPNILPELTFQYSPRYSSHIPILIKIFEMSKGPVLEMGSGIFSTPLLHWLCLETKRKLVTYENYVEHYEMNKVFASDTHEIIFTNDWDSIKIDDTHWGMAFIDHEPTQRRVIDIKRLKDNTDFVVVHDTEESHDSMFGYIENAFPLFKYRYNYKRRRPYTSILSNLVDVTKL